MAGSLHELLLNCGGENHEGYIGLQDHGNNVWFRNIRVKRTVKSSATGENSSDSL